MTIKILSNFNSAVGNGDYLESGLFTSMPLRLHAGDRLIVAFSDDNGGGMAQNNISILGNPNNQPFVFNSSLRYETLIATTGPWFWYSITLSEDVINSNGDFYLVFNSSGASGNYVFGAVWFLSGVKDSDFFVSASTVSMTPTSGTTRSFTSTTTTPNQCVLGVVSPSPIDTTNPANTINAFTPSGWNSFLVRNAGEAGDPIGCFSAISKVDVTFSTTETVSCSVLGPTNLQVYSIRLLSNEKVKTLMYESWNGSGLVAGKVPNFGGGTWLVTGQSSYSNGTVYQNLDAGSGCFHSVTYTNSRITTDIINVESFRGATVTVELFARATTTAASTCYKAVLHPNYVIIMRRVNGVDTQLAGNTRSEYSSDVESALEVSGSTIRVYIGGALFLEATDTSITGPGYSGFYTNWAFVDEDTGSLSSNVGRITISEPFSQLSSNLPGKNLSVSPTAGVGVGYLGSGDIALLSTSLVAALNATQIPVDIKKLNNATILGTGTAVDKWRGVGV